MKQTKNKFKGKMELFLILLLISGTVIGIAGIIEKKYGDFHLSPGEHYIVNVPFLGASKNPSICGKAIESDGDPVNGVNVTVRYCNNETVIAWNLTDEKGYYCLNLPEIKKDTKYDVFVAYNENLTIGSNEYDLNLYTEKSIYNKSVDKYVMITGNILNQDAKVENGRMEVNLQRYKENGTGLLEIFPYKSYYINIDPNKAQPLPNDDVNISWEIPTDTPAGKYKFYVKASFNANEHAKSIYFNVTE